MLRDHPKGIYVAFAINACERFAFYTMIAVLSLFLQAKYGLSVAETGDYYSWFYFGIYATALLGGAAADWLKQYRSVILIGQLMMIAGYLLMAMPFVSFGGSMAALFIIALGNGFFKGNLQVVVGRLYDEERYAKLRDSAFLFFFMGVNIGAFAAPYIASEARNWWLSFHGLLYDSSLPSLCHQFLNNTLTDMPQFQALAQKASLSAEVVNLHEFANNYIQVFSQGYNWAFGIAAFMMLFSLFVFLVFKKRLPDSTVVPTVKQFFETFQIKQPLKQRKVTLVTTSLIIITIILFQLIPGLDVGGKFGLSFAVGLFMAFIAFIYLMSTDEERPNVVSLILLFIITVFFWMVFNQNGLVLTQFALEHTAKEVDAVTNLLFDFKSILCVVIAVIGIGMVFHHKSTLRYRFIGGMLVFLFGGMCYYFVQKSPPQNVISPEIFQSFNPLFVLLLMPLVVWFFKFLEKRGTFISSPRQIIIGLIIAGLAFVVLAVGSSELATPNLPAENTLADSARISPYWLINTYLMLTLAEVFLSPMGASFVSRVSPKRFKGLMQGGWLFTTAVGSKFLVLGSYLWDKVEVHILWIIFATICIVSALIMFTIVKRLERS